MQFSLNFLKEFLRVDLKADKLASLLTMAGLEVGHFHPEGADWVFEVEITSNRYDWLSILGIAREAAASIGAQIKLEHPKIVKKPLLKTRTIKIESLKDCSAYIARVIGNIEVKPSDATLKERVVNCNINSINNVVDITNYCMLKWGNPLHAFDEDKLEGNIYIRRARNGEKFIGIDEKERELCPENLVIADDKKVIALAGVMGAKNTEVTGKTKNIFLEAAIFSPLVVRHSRRAAGLDTDSSYRFERQVFSGYLEYASSEAAKLIEENCKGTFIGYAFSGKGISAKDKKLSLKISELNEYLGTNIAKNKIKSILTSLGFKIKESGKDVLFVSAPAFRLDINSLVDVYEEVSRIYGYDKIEPQIPTVSRELIKNELYDFKNEVRKYLSTLGLKEIITYSMESEDDLAALGFNEVIKVVNPLRKQENALRPTLLPGMVKTIAYNINRMRQGLRFFELANIYNKGKDGFCEIPALSLAAAEQDGGFFYIKGAIDELLKYLNITAFSFKQKSFPSFTNALELFVNNKSAGFVGKLDKETGNKFNLKKDLYFAQLDVTLLQSERKLKNYSSISPYPVIWRDISIALHKDKQFSDVVAVINERKEFISDYSIVDTYKGKDLAEGYSAFSLRIFYQSPEKTLISEEVDAINNEIRKHLEQTEGIKLR
ncbi:MAG: phenylalanine--tRNA ligase subunit beta [Candidatus Omnitrophota bacterium]|jgi:phenylalanyl-tRNA synthetase beta chain